MRSLVAVGLALTVCAVSAAQQPTMPTFRAVTVLTELDVLPVGPGGTIIRGLTAADFTVVEEGKPQVVASVEFIDVDAQATPPLPVGVVSNGARGASRAWVLVVDDLRTGRALQSAVRSALSQLVSALSPGDTVALVPTSGRRAHRVEFTRDTARVQAAIARLQLMEAGVGQRELGRPPGGSTAWDVTSRQGSPASRNAPIMGTSVPQPSPASGGTEPMLDSPELSAEAADDRLLTTIADASAMVGRASASRVLMVVVSSGLPVTVDPDALRTLDQADLLRGLQQETTGEFQRIRPWEASQQRDRRMHQTARLVMAAQRGGVTIYGVNPLHLDQLWQDRLLTAQQTDDARERLRVFDDQANPLAGHPYGFLGALSAGTGGVTFTGLLAPGAVARSLKAESGTYYLVRYYPTRQVRDDRLREVRVEVRRPGVTVRARSRYATSARPRLGAQVSDLSVALAEVLPRSDVRLEARPTVTRGQGGSSTLRVTLRIVPEGANWQAGDRYEIAVVAVDEEGRQHGRRGGSLVAGAPSLPRGGQVALDRLPRGRYQVRVAVRDVARERVGSVFADVDVP